MTTTKNTTKSRIEEDMGYVQLQFVELDADRNHYRYANDVKNPMEEAFPKWRKPWLKRQMGSGANKYFAVLTLFRPAPGSKSGGSYSILGVLARFETCEEMVETNFSYWRYIQTGATGFEKLGLTFGFACAIQKWFEETPDDYITQTHELLEMCAGGHLKEVKKIVKEFV